MLRIILVSLFTFFFTTFSWTAFSQDQNCPFSCPAGCEVLYNDDGGCVACECPSDQSDDCVPFAIPLDQRCTANGFENWFSKQGCWKGCINKSAVESKLVDKIDGACPESRSVDCDAAVQAEFGTIPVCGTCGRTRSQCLKQFGLECDACEIGRCCGELGGTVEECFFGDAQPQWTFPD